MSVVTLFCGSYCHGEEVANSVAGTLGYRLVDDRTLVAETGSRFQIDEGKILKAITGKTSIFNKFTHEKERSLACLQAVLAGMLKRDNLVFLGFAGLMIPREISHVLKSCIIADVKYRARVAMESGMPEREALKAVHRDDESRVLWIEHLFKTKDPWNPDFYDILIPMDKNSVESAAAVIVENARKGILIPTEASRKAVDDYVLASEVNLVLAREGHEVSTSAKDGTVTVTINKNVLRLSALEDELKRVAGATPGVRSVETRVGPGYYQSDIYRRYDFDVPLPSKVLLVDDEREFAQTLSERLQMRDLGSAVVYDGESALSVVAEEEPEVMVLDLKMPGVDGLEVLRRVKREHPNVEVIVLTGHGSREIEEECMAMGACAYLEKPVDIEALTAKMQEAYQKIKERKTQSA